MMWTSWPASCSSPAMNVPTAPPPAMTTFIECDLRPVRRRCRSMLASARGRPSTARYTTSPSWVTRSGDATCATPMRLTRDRPGDARDLDVAERAARPSSAATGRSTSDDRGARVDPVALGGVGHELAQHPVDRPLHRGDGRDAESLVDDRPAGVVDAGDDPLDAEGLAGDPGREDVGVVAVGDRRDGASASRMPASSRRSRSKPTPTTCCPPKPSCRRRNASGSLSTTATEWPLSSMIRARPEPTRPQPTMTTCMWQRRYCTARRRSASTDREPADAEVPLDTTPAS